MTTDRALAMLLAWTSPSYPVGAFSYSHGLEAAVEDGAVRDLVGLVDYVTAVLARGGGWVDAVLFAAAWRASASPPSLSREGQGWVRASARQETAHLGQDCRTEASSPCPAYPPPAPPLKGRGEEELGDINELAVAFRGSAETALESRQMGRSFLSVTRAAWPHPALDAFAARHAGRPVAHAVVGALACSAHGVPLGPALTAWLHGTAANLVSAGVRLVPLGQTDGQIATARLMPMIADTVARALVADLDDLGTAAPLVELASLAHETQYSRLFRS